jgi:hypothetical protein
MNPKVLLNRLCEKVAFRWWGLLVAIKIIIENKRIYGYIGKSRKISPRNVTQTTTSNTLLYIIICYYKYFVQKQRGFRHARDYHIYVPSLEIHTFKSCTRCNHLWCVLGVRVCLWKVIFNSFLQLYDLSHFCFKYVW